MPQQIVVWPTEPPHPDYTCYWSATKKIYIKYGDDTRALDVIQHEYSHAVMDNEYTNGMPVTPGNPHLIKSASDNITALVEGWADFFPLLVQANATSPPSPWVWEYGGGGQEDLENHTWGTPGWQNGDTVEG